ncbi:hypothetical protein P608_19035 [Comamonas thiooxydans]|uniref:Uncharacterized protein n=1 Tax=Comamonas thiooxydans TaxID=363952 RepID=A0A0E3BR97_9BURK|nr:hypothetical protein P608_19035 [Comamonas thiooxydans]KGH16786.1 hypothetical protein P607_18835 [Comamonas thiooxydans]
MPIFLQLPEIYGTQFLKKNPLVNQKFSLLKIQINTIAMEEKMVIIKFQLFHGTWQSAIC